MVSNFGDAVALNNLRKRGLLSGLLQPEEKKVRLAMLGGCNLRPLADLVEHFVSSMNNVTTELWCGDYDNYVSEIMDADSALYAFAPEIIFLLPSEQRCTYPGALTDPSELHREYADQVVSDLLSLCATARERTGAEILVANYPLPGYFDPGPLRYTSLASEYNLRKYVNLELGLRLPAFAHLCDVEFLANRRGTVQSADRRAWFESKQPMSADLMVDVARETGWILASLTRPSKKVLVLDLDNTLWGGVIGDDGVEGIEIGTTSSRGEAFRDFQLYLKSLTKRGVLLAVASKNDYRRAIEPFELHPEMILRMKDIVCFKANWEPKSDNLRAIARELNVGLDSLVFVDDNPAEIDIVNQYASEVTTILLGEDPSTFSTLLRNSRLFEARTITAEDAERTTLYRKETERQLALTSSTDFASYLESLQMTAEISEFHPLDIPRVTQLINKSNQFNVTTRRRTEAEVQALLCSPRHACFTVRLADKFGDHGLISVVICVADQGALVVDTWLMSCRVLKRQVEEEVLNEILRLARELRCSRVVGHYLPTEKNGMVRELYPSLGFAPLQTTETASSYELNVADYGDARPTKIRILRGVHEPVASH